MTSSSKEEKERNLFTNQLRVLTGETNFTLLNKAYCSCDGDISLAIEYINKHGKKHEVNGMPDLTGRTLQKAPSISVLTQSHSGNQSTMTKRDQIKSSYDSRSKWPTRQNSVIDLTDPDEAQLQRAIKLSMESNASQPLNATEKTVVHALSNSQSSVFTGGAPNGILSADNPHMRRRRGLNWPAGLRNVGNTCWFSAVIQSLFHLPFFRNLILQYKPPLTSPPTDSQKHRNILFMQELKNLFALLIGSNQSYVDPTKCVWQLKSGFVTDNEHQQQDVSEFTHKLLDWLEDAMSQKPEFSASLEKDNDQASPMDVDVPRESTVGTESESNPMVDLFYGEYKAHGINNGNSFTKPQKFGIFPLYVDGVDNLHDGIAVTTHDPKHQDSDMRGRESVGQEHWFTKLPPVLIFELSRFHYNQRSEAPEKIHSRFDFPHLLYMDRYMELNLERTRRCREECTTLAQQLQSIKEELKKRRKTQDSLKCCTEFAASRRKRYIETKQSNRSAKRRRSSSGGTVESDGAGDWQEMEETDQNIEKATVVEQCVKGWLDELEHEKEGLRDNINDIRKRIDTMYDDPALKQHPYDLHAVLVHQGVAVAGHYWAFIKDHRRSRWLKFNDTNVMESDWEELIADSIGGGQGCTSAYCLMYVDRKQKELLMGQDSENLISRYGELKDLVEKHNAEFENELEEWDIEQAKLLSLTILENSEKGESTTAVTQGSTEVKKELPKPEKNDASTFWNVTECKKAIDKAVNVYETLGSEETIDHEVLSVALQASMLAISSASDAFNLKGPDAALFEVVREEFDRLKKIAYATSNESDARLQHVAVYMFKNRAPKKIIERTLLEQFADDRMSYSHTATEIMKSAKEKLSTLSAEDLNEEEYQRWHRDYRFFCKATCSLIQGVELWHKCKHSEALPYLANVKTENDRLSATGEDNPDRLANWDLAVRTIELCIEALHNKALIDIQMGTPDGEERRKGAINVLVDSIVPWIHLLPTESPGMGVSLLNKIRSEWCDLDLRTENLQEKYECAVQALMEPPAASDFHMPTLIKPRNPQDLCERFQNVMSMISRS